MDFEDDDWGDSSDSDDDWGDGGDDWKRRKREVNNKEGSRLTEEKKEKDMVERRERKKRKVVDNLETPLVPEEENRRVKRDAATKWKKGVQVWHILLERSKKLRELNSDFRWPRPACKRYSTDAFKAQLVLYT